MRIQPLNLQQSATMPIRLFSLKYIMPPRLNTEAVDWVFDLLFDAANVVKPCSDLREVSLQYDLKSFSRLRTISASMKRLKSSG